jgi:hypothetical protein
VDARQDADLRGDRAHGVERTAVDADLGGQHRVAHGLVFEFAEFLRQLGGLPAVGFSLLRQRGHHVLLQCGNGVLALQLVAHREGLGQAIADGGLQRVDQARARGRRCPVHFGLPASATSALMVSIATCICWWPNTTAPSITSSDSSAASDSTISTASLVPATTSSSCDSFSSLTVGLSRYWPFL